ncbi:MAG: hypothetical protein RIC35_01120 [Marinoscillum sp.]
MSLFDFLRLIYRNLKMLAIVPVVLAVTVYLLTMNQAHEYKSNALIYTGIGSGYNIESGSNSKTDYKEVNAAYDNLMSIIKSRLTLEEVGLRLLALNLSQTQPGPVIGKIAFDKLTEVIPMEKRKEFVIDNDPEKTYQNILVLYQNGYPAIVQMIRGKGSYSISTLQSIDTKRVKSSDMISVEFSTYDPGLCKNTLDVLLDVFSKRYLQLKEAETGNVVAYFEAELSKAKANLNQAEDELTDFRVSSRVINYGEETKALAIKKQNATEEFAIKTMNLKATEAAIAELENKLEIREKMMANNLDLINKKRQLGQITSEISRLQVAHAKDSVLQAWLITQDQIRNDIEQFMMTAVSQSSTKEGISGQQVVNQWLDEVIKLHRERVTVEMFKKRLQDIDNQYDIFTPMGSNIDRLERQINVYEREYLEVLHGLNMSKLRQQNIEMTSQLEILDAPTYPLEPEASKRGLLIIVGFMVGLMGVLGSVLAADLLDNSIRHPERAKRTTQMDVAGTLPVIDEKFNKKYGDLAQQVTGIMASKIKLDKYSINHTGATVIAGISTQKGEGKSFALNLLFQEMLKSGESVCLVTSQKNETDTPHRYVYEQNDQFVSDRELLSKYTFQYQYVLVELPAWVSGKIPVHVIEHSQLILWTIRADKVWSTAHINMKTDLEKITKVTPSLVLNGVKPHFLDQVVAEVPVKRNFITKWIRKIVRFELGNARIKSTS